MAGLDTVHISLRNPDFTTSRRVASAINAYIGSRIAQPLDPATVRMLVPDSYRGQAVALITDIEQLRVTPDMPAKVVIDEQTGVIVMGENVRINTVAVAQGNLTIRITETPQVSQPQPFADQGETVTVPRTQIEINEDADNKLTVLSQSVTLQELVWLEPWGRAARYDCDPARIKRPARCRPRLVFKGPAQCRPAHQFRRRVPSDMLALRKTCHKTSPPAARQTATEFEAVFLAQMLRHMMSGIGTEGVMGGGQAEKIYRDMMVDEMGKSIAQRGGIGIADQLYAQLIKAQEVTTDGQPTAND